MTLAHSARRGIATATGGLVVVGAGAAAGVIIADMQAAWADEEALEMASTVAAQPADVAPVRPVVVTLIEERHVTPEPVVVSKKVYRTRIVGGGTSGATSQAPQQKAPRRSTPSGQSPPAASAPKPQKPRTVVAPAPKAPAPSSGQASSGTTSATS